MVETIYDHDNPAHRELLKSVKPIQRIMQDDGTIIICEPLEEVQQFTAAAIRELGRI